MSKILVTGGAGFIGHNVVNKLESLGNEVIVQDNLTSYGSGRIKEMARLHKERRKNFTCRFFNSDITRNITCINIDTHKPDMIIHLASYPRAKIVNDDPAVAVPTMTTGLMNLLVAGARNDLKRFVYISSSMVYGDFVDGITEDAICKPGSIYASLKLAGEQITKQFAKKHGFEYTIIRPSAVYGPLDVKDRVVSHFLINAMNNKKLSVHGEHELLDFSYVGDVADGIVVAALSDNGANQTFNITFGKSELISTAAQVMIDIVGAGKIDICDPNPSMPSRGHLDISKAIELLGYDPKISIAEGFKLYYDWAKQFSDI